KKHPGSFVAGCFYASIARDTARALGRRIGPESALVSRPDFCRFLSDLFPFANDLFAGGLYPCRMPTTSPRPRLAIIAYDGKKADLVAFATFNRDWLSDYDLIGTGATADLLENKVGLAVERVSPGPEGGDVQIASRVVQGEVDAVLFIVDPLDSHPHDSHPHDPDIQTLLRICNVRNVPLATNIATADVLISSPLLEGLRVAS